MRGCLDSRRLTLKYSSPLVLHLDLDDIERIRQNLSRSAAKHAQQRCLIEWRLIGHFGSYVLVRRHAESSIDHMAVDCRRHAKIKLRETLVLNHLAADSDESLFLPMQDVFLALDLVTVWR